MQSNNGCTARHTTTVTAATTDSDRDDDEIDVEEAAAMRVKNRARGRTTVLEGADGLAVELGGRQRSRRSSCVSFSIVGQRDDKRDSREEEDEDEEVSDEEVVLVGRTNNEDHED